MIDDVLTVCSNQTTICNLDSSYFPKHVKLGSSASQSLLSRATAADLGRIPALPTSYETHGILFCLLDLSLGVLFDRY